MRKITGHACIIVFVLVVAGGPVTCNLTCRSNGGDAADGADSADNSVAEEEPERPPAAYADMTEHTVDSAVGS